MLYYQFCHNKLRNTPITPLLPTRHWWLEIHSGPPAPRTRGPGQPAAEVPFIGHQLVPVVVRRWARGPGRCAWKPTPLVSMVMGAGEERSVLFEQKQIIDLKIFQDTWENINIKNILDIKIGGDIWNCWCLRIWVNTIIECFVIFRIFTISVP